MPLSRRDLMKTTLLAPLAGCGGEAPETAAPVPQAESVEADGRVEIRFDGEPYTSFYIGDEWDKPFLHPLSTPSGVRVTRGFPVVSLPAESQDHPWHRGIIWGHGLINGYDFWREQGRDKTAQLRITGPGANAVGGGWVEINGTFAMFPPNSESIGTCRQVYRLERTAEGVQIDAWITVLADQGQPLTFGDTEDGGFGFRFHDAFRQDRGAQLLNSDGLIGTENIWGKRAHWVQYSTQVEGKPASVTIFDHSSNLRHPTYWHARDYGLCAANPFGLHDFLGDPNEDGSHTVEAGGELMLRYRVLIADGVTPVPEVERLFEAFAG